MSVTAKIYYQPSGEIRRIALGQDTTLDQLQQLIARNANDPSSTVIKYEDDEKDLVTVRSNDEWQEALRVMNAGILRLTVNVVGGKDRIRHHRHHQCPAGDKERVSHHHHCTAGDKERAYGHYHHHRHNHHHHRFPEGDKESFNGQCSRFGHRLSEERVCGHRHHCDKEKAGGLHRHSHFRRGLMWRRFMKRFFTFPGMQRHCHRPAIHHPTIVNRHNRPVNANFDWFQGCFSDRAMERQIDLGMQWRKHLFGGWFKPHMKLHGKRTLNKPFAPASNHHAAKHFMHALRAPLMNFTRNMGHNHRTEVLNTKVNRCAKRWRRAMKFGASAKETNRAQHPAPPTVEAPVVDDRTDKEREVMQKLDDMGFTNHALTLRCIRRCNGDMTRTVRKLLRWQKRHQMKNCDRSQHFQSVFH